MPPANDDPPVSLDDAILLVDEIRRLRSQLAEREAQIAELDAIAHVDSLVHLPNRRSFVTSVDRVIARVQRSDVDAALIYVDVDGLKEINDRFGHNAGDETLVHIARVIVDNVRNTDLVGRLAGDEFAVLLEDTDELTAWHAAARIAESMESSECCVEQVRIPLSVAVGVAVILPDDSAATALGRADKEMYRIKTIGRKAHFR
jgi:diguanylate cyclase (GGDEF)-like protein